MRDLSAWPKGMRVIAREERHHPGAQLRFADIDGHRFTCFATSTKGGQLGDLELRHRRRARCEGRIRCTKTLGCASCPSRGSRRTISGARSSRWPANCSPGCRCSPSTAPPADGNQTPSAAPVLRRRRIARRGRRLRLRIAATWPWATRPPAITRLHAYAPGYQRNCHYGQEGNHQCPWNPATRRDSGPPATPRR